MAGYSGTPLTKKLGVKPGHRVLVLDAPKGFELALPDGAKIGRHARGTCDLILSFHADRAGLEQRIGGLRELMEPDGGLWIAWPKKAAKTGSDITEKVVRDIALANRLVDNKVCAIDQTWSGLRLVIRIADRAG